MKLSSWWAASGSAALLLALGSFASSSVNAGEKVQCEGGGNYDNYLCYSLDREDIQSSGTFFNGSITTYDETFTPPTSSERYEFGYVNLYYRPKSSGNGYIGNQFHATDTTMFLYEGDFPGGDLTEAVIDRIISFNDDYHHIRNAPKPPGPNSCNDSDLMCPQVRWEFEEGEIYTVVISHMGALQFELFEPNKLPLSVYSSISGKFSEEIDQIYASDIDFDGPYNLSSVKSGATNPVFEGGTLLVDEDGETDIDFTVNKYDTNTIDNNEKTIDFKGVFSGEGGLTFKGSGTTTLSGKNTYAGPTVVEQGTLRTTNPSDSNSHPLGIPVGNKVTIKEGAVLDVAGGTFLCDPAYPRNCFVLTLDGGTLASRNEKVYAVVEVDISLSGKKQSTFDVEESQRINLRGDITGDGGITKVGPGILNIDKVNYGYASGNNYRGDTLIKEGTLRIFGAALKHPLSDTTRVVVDDGATFWVAAMPDLGFIEVGSIEGEGEIILGQYNTTLIAGRKGDTTFSGNISDISDSEPENGIGGFTKVGRTTTTTFSGVNTYTGPTLVKEGTLRLGSATGVPKESATTIEKDGTLDLNGQGDVEITSLTLDGGTIQNKSGKYVSLSSSEITVVNDSLITNVYFSNIAIGNIKGKGGLTFDSEEGGFDLYGVNTYEGETIVKGDAILTAKNEDAFSPSSRTSLQGGWWGAPWLELGGFSQRIDDLYVQNENAVVKEGELENKYLYNIGRVNLASLIQPEGSRGIVNSGNIDLGSLQAGPVTNSGTLKVVDQASVESLTNTGTSNFATLHAGRVVNAAGLTVSGTAVISYLENKQSNLKATFGLLQGTDSVDGDVFKNTGSIEVSDQSSTNNDKG